MKTWQNQKWIIIIFFAFLNIFWIAIRLPTVAEVLIDTDGGHQLAGALQILHGEHPFVDYEATYGPLTFYASALAQIIFGQRFIGEVILRTLGYAIAYVFLALLIYRITGKTALVFLFGILALLVMPRLYKYYIVFGPVLTVWFAWYYIDHPKLRNIFWLALAVVVSGLFRSDFGVYCAIAATIAVVLQPSYQVDGLKRAFILWGETFLLALPWLLFLAFKGGLDNYFFDILVGGPNIAAGMSRPFPAFQFNQFLFSADNLIFLALIFFFCFPIISLLFIIARWKYIEDRQRKMLLTLTILYIFSLLQVFARIGYPHLTQAIPLAFVLAAWMVNRLWANMKLPVFTRISVVYLFILSLLCGGILTPVLLVNSGGWPAIRVQGIPEKLRQYSLPKDKMLASVGRETSLWYAETMQYIRRCTTDQQRLMALPIFTTFYYFTNRSFGGGQISVVSGYFVTKADQERIVMKMKEEDIPLIVYWPNFIFDDLPERKLEVVAPAVASYIQSNYRKIKKENKADLMLRNDLNIEKQVGALANFSCPVSQP